MNLRVLAPSFILYSAIASGQISLSFAERSAFLETLAKGSDARIIWSREIASLEGGASRAIFTGLAVADPTQQGLPMRGVRIDLSGHDSKAVVYLDEGTLEHLKRMSDQLSLAVQSTTLKIRSNGEGYLGSCEFRDNPSAFPVHLDYCYSGSCSPALRIISPAPILFPGRTPSDFSKILAMAIERIKAH